MLEPFETLSNRDGTVISNKRRWRLVRSTNAYHRGKRYNYHAGQPKPSPIADPNTATLLPDRAYCQGMGLPFS